MNNELSDIELHLLEVAGQFLHELKAGHASRALSLDAALDRELGLGSLERIELSRRIENAFSIQLPVDQLGKISLLRDFIPLIELQHPVLQETKAFSPQLNKSSIDPNKSTTLIDLLAAYAHADPDRPHIYLRGDDEQEQTITYGELFQKAGGIAQLLIDRRLKPGETVAMMLPTSQEYFFIFFGILLAGAIPVPIYPPTHAERIEEYVRRQAKVLQNAEIRFLITFGRALTLSQLLKSFVPSLYEVLSLEDLKNLPLKTISWSAKPTDAALIQYTSGSTGDPKGVLLTHQNLLSNIRSINQVIQVRGGDCLVSWLPLYHDMGLIGTWLGSLYYGVPICILSPLTFLMRPERWLWAIHYHRATISGAPNFAYELCINKISNNKIVGLDLSSWRIAFNGSETIHASTIRRFSKKFASYSFNSKAMMPGYGLAESTVALLLPPLNREPKIDLIDRDAFMQQGRAIPANPKDKLKLEIVSCGAPLPGHTVRIVDNHDKLMKEREVGSLQFKGPSTMSGYYRNPDATTKAFHTDWVDTGDLAYQANSEVYITGRKKDIIITAGRNIYPEEIEKIVNTVNGIRQGCALAFSVPDFKSGTEQCIVVAETEEKTPTARQKMMGSISTEVALSLNIRLEQVILVDPHTVPKTASGKLQRSACKQAYLENKLFRHKRPLWMQISKLFFISQGVKIWRGLIQLGKIIYTIYAWLMSITTFFLLWLMVLVSSQKTSCRLLSGWARLLLKLIFCRLKIEGQLENVKSQVMILISNHTSYIDAVVLLAALPIDMAFIVKKELVKLPILRTFIKKLKYIQVDRIDFSQSIHETKEMQKLLMQGRSVLIFPEGTFTYAAGLRAFKMGAFKLAIDTQIPICPIGLKGTRHMFRGDQWLLAPSVLTVTVGEPIMTQKDGWDEMARLRDIARKEIFKHSGEPPINLISAGL